MLAFAVVGHWEELPSKCFVSAARHSSECFRNAESQRADCARRGQPRQHVLLWQHLAGLSDCEPSIQPSERLPQLCLPPNITARPTFCNHGALQALASCHVVLQQLESTLQALSASSLTAAPLAAALTACLRQLQPQPVSARQHSVTPRALLHALLSRIPEGTLKPGQEHDAAEAVELLGDLLAQELQAAFLRGPAKQMALRASVAAVAGAAGSAAEPAAGDSFACNGSSNGGQLCRRVNTGAGMTAVQGPPVGESRGVAMHSSPAVLPDPELAMWQQHAWLPLRGANAHELCCVRCRHRSAVQLSPFWVLPLGIATLPSATLLGNVPAAPDATLEGSLASFYSYEAVQGWHCPRCSLAASLAAAAAAGTEEQAAGAGAAREAGGNGAPVLPPVLERLRMDLEQGGLLGDSDAYAGMLKSAGEWPGGQERKLPRPPSLTELPFWCCLRLDAPASAAFAPSHRHCLAAASVPGSAANGCGPAAPCAVPAAASWLLVPPGPPCEGDWARSLPSDAGPAPAAHPRAGTWLGMRSWRAAAAVARRIRRQRSAGRAG
jgi:hypothetical protein